MCFITQLLLSLLTWSLVGQIKRHLGPLSRKMVLLLLDFCHSKSQFSHLTTVLLVIKIQKYYKIRAKIWWNDFEPYVIAIPIAARRMWSHFNLKLATVKTNAFEESRIGINLTLTLTLVNNRAYRPRPAQRVHGRVQCHAPYVSNSLCFKNAPYVSKIFQNLET